MTADTNEPTPKPGGAPQLDESSAERSAFMAEIRKEVHDARRKRMLKYGGGGAIGVALLFALIIYWAVKPDRKGCFANDARKVAFESVRAEGDTATRSALSSRFNRREFRCAEIAEPKGTLVAVKEDGDPIVWYVDDNGKAYNVNLLSAAWTPRLETGPKLSDDQIAAVVK
ncbi:MAG TPA: hypothetical protein VM166_15500 [Gemmatimonadaceae bacterium]|nr:hypothetical protein [Gemmatimonadaceae bacterium]